MKLSQVTQAIAIAHKARRPVFMWGQPGIGKSDVVLQAGNKQGWRCAGEEKLRAHLRLILIL